MKKLIFLFILTIYLFSNNELISQDNRVGITYNPFKHGKGVLVYNYNTNHLYSIDYKELERVFTIGIGEEVFNVRNTQAFVLINYNQLLVNEYSSLRRISFELIGIYNFNTKFGTITAFDFINFEGRFGIIYKL